MHFKYCFNVVFLYHSFLVLTVKKKLSRKTAENEQTLFIYTSTESVYISTVFGLIRTHQYTAQFIRFWFWSWCGSNRRKRRIIPISLMCFPDSKTRTKAKLRCIVCQQHVSCHIPWARSCQKWQKNRFYAFPQLDGLPCRQWVGWSGGLGFVLI